MPRLTGCRIGLNNVDNNVNKRSVTSFRVCNCSLSGANTITDRLTDFLHRDDVVARICISRRSCRPRVIISFSHRGLTRRGLKVGATTKCIQGLVCNSVLSCFHRSNRRCRVGIHCRPSTHVAVRSIRGVAVPGNLNKGMQVHSITGIVRDSVPPAVRHGSQRECIRIGTILTKKRTLSRNIRLNETCCRGVTLPGNIAVRITNSCRSRVSTGHSLKRLNVVVVLLIFIIVTTRFRSLACPFVVVVSIPLTTSNVVVTLVLARAILGVVSVLNTVVLVNVIIGGNVILVSCARLRQRHNCKLVCSTIATTHDHLEPVLVATLAAVLNVIPVTASRNINTRL